MKSTRLYLTQSGIRTPAGQAGFTLVEIVIVLTIIVGSFDGDVMQPLVMGKAVNLHPLAIVIVIAAGSIALGIVGALIAVPVAGAIYGVAKYVTGRDPEHPYKATEPFDHSTA